MNPSYSNWSINPDREKLRTERYCKAVERAFFWPVVTLSWLFWTGSVIWESSVWGVSFVGTEGAETSGEELIIGSESNIWIELII